MPWVPLCRFSGPPAPVLRQCRIVIDRVAAAEERANLVESAARCDSLETFRASLEP